MNSSKHSALIKALAHALAIIMLAAVAAQAGGRPAEGGPTQEGSAPPPAAGAPGAPRPPPPPGVAAEPGPCKLGIKIPAAPAPEDRGESLQRSLPLGRVD